MKAIPILNVNYLLRYPPWGPVQQRGTTHIAMLEGLLSTHDLLDKVLATGVNQLIRLGIDRGFPERHEDLAVVRGRLTVGDTAKRELRARGRAACDFKELSADILSNRPMQTSLRRLLARQTSLQCEVRNEVWAAYRSFDGVSRVRLRKSTSWRLQPGGNRHL